MKKAVHEKKPGWDRGFTRILLTLHKGPTFNGASQEGSWGGERNNGKAGGGRTYLFWRHRCANYPLD